MPALRWSNAARRDLLDIWTWRGRDYPERAIAHLIASKLRAAVSNAFPILVRPFRELPQMRESFRSMPIWSCIGLIQML